MKKLLAILLAAAMVLSLGATAVFADDVSYEVTEPIEIVWWHALEDQYTPLVNEIVEAFNASQDLITVTAQYIGSYTEVNEALVSANAAGSGLPAVVVANTPYVAQYGASGLYEDLGPYIEATGYDVSDFSTGLLISSQYEGKQVALPFLHSTQVIYYNKTIADKYGIEVPDSMTYEQFKAFAEAGKAALEQEGAEEAYGAVFGGWDQWYYETLYLNQGVEIITEDGTTDLDSDKAIAVTEFIKGMVDDGTSYLAYGSGASANMRQKFYDQNAFCVMHTSSLYNTYVSNCPDFEVGMIWFPTGDDGTHNSEVGGCVLGIPSANDQATKNAAWVFLQYLCGKEVNMKWAEGTGYIPTRNSVLTTDEGVAFLEAKPAFQCIFDNLNLINPRIQDAHWSELANIWMDYMNRMINEGDDIASSSADMAEEINEILAE